MSRIKQIKEGLINKLLWTSQSNISAKLGFDGTVFETDKPLRLPDGTAASPSLQFNGSTGVGLYESGSNILGIATAGTERVTVDAQGDMNVGTYISIGNGGTGQIVGQKTAVVSGNAIDTAGAVALTAGQSGTLFLMDKADGLTFTLPSAVVGLTYEFFVNTTVTSVGYGIDTDGTDNFEGCVLNVDKDQTYSSTEALQIFCKADGTPTHIDMNGGTTGGILGSRIRVTAITTDRWMVEGIIHGDGNLATIFS
jgi:hypothetical protein